jgi:Pvc16 N-terminal domain
VIQAVDRALEDFLRAKVPLSAQAVDISFQPPDRSWGAGLTRPTINLFMWDILRNPGQMRTGLNQRLTGDGDIERRPSNPVVDLVYLVTAWATEIRDEHQLLGTVMESVLGFGSIPADVLPDRLAGTKCGLSLAPADRRIPGDFWSALDGRLKPGLQLQVTLPIEVFQWQLAARPPEGVDLDLQRTTPGPAPSGGQRVTGTRRTPPRSAPEPEAPAVRRGSGSLVMEGRPPKKPAGS